MSATELFGTDDEIAALLADAEVWAIVGLSANQRRPAYGVARFLQERGKRIVPVHPRADTVHGEQGYAALADVPLAIDVVDLFVRSDLAGAVVDQAFALDRPPRAVWLQLGVLDEDAAVRARSAGLVTVMDRCPAIEWPRLGPST